MKLQLIAETELARLYRDEANREQWVPRSVCRHTLKHPPQGGKPPLHVVEIEDWWLEEHPFSGLKPRPSELF